MNCQKRLLPRYSRDYSAPGIAHFMPRDCKPTTSADIANGRATESSSSCGNTIAITMRSTAARSRKMTPASTPPPSATFPATTKRLRAAKSRSAESAPRTPALRWTKEDDVIDGLRKSQKSGKPMSDSAVRRETAALYGAAVRLFGSFTSARNAAGIQWNRKKG